jgi:DivIVA domain-containing protein
MPTDDLDRRAQPTAERIRRRDFEVVRRGYDPQQVRAYLFSIANQMAALETELSQVRREAAAAAAQAELASAPQGSSAPPTEDPYDAFSKRFATLIEVADQEAEKILEDARSEASQALSEAAREADRIKAEAQSQAEGTRQEIAALLERANAESDRVLSGLAERRRSLFTQLEDMRGKLIAVTEGLGVSVDEALRADADALPADADDLRVDADALAAEAGALRVDADDVVRVDAEDAELEHTSGGGDADGGDDTGRPVDRFEDLWANKDEPLQVPDLATLEGNLEERDT